MYTYIIHNNPFLHFTIHIVLYFYYRADTILYSMKMFLIAYIQGCKSVSSIGGNDQHILVTFFDIGGMILRFLFLMTFLLAGLFFHHLLLKFNYGGDGGQILGGCIPPGFAALRTSVT